MKKFYTHFLLVLAAIAVTVNAGAQTTQAAGGVLVKGRLLNAADQTEKLAGANVSVIAAEDTLKTISDANGLFSLSNVPRGIIEVKISYLGFTPYSLQLKADVDATQVDFGTILMVEGSMDLSEVSVIGQIQMMTTRGDTVVYNPAAFQSVAGDYAIDLIVKFPGVEITEEGTLTAHGEEVKWALVDGRLMFGPDVMNTISNVKADDIEEVKVYDIVDPEAVGADVMKDASDMQRVMDFTTKSKFKGMINVEVLGGAGKDMGESTAMTPDMRYKGEFNFGKFSESRMIMGDILTNNTREPVTELVRGFMGGGRGTGYRGGGDGLGKRNRLDFHFSNYNPFLNRNKWQYNFHYSFTRNYDEKYNIREEKRLDMNQIRVDTTLSDTRADEHTVVLHLRKRWSNANFSITPIVQYTDGSNGSMYSNTITGDSPSMLSTVSDKRSNGLSTTGTVKFSQAFLRPEQKGATVSDPIMSMIQGMFGGSQDENKRPPITLVFDAGWKYSNNNTVGSDIESEMDNEGRHIYNIDINGKTRGANAGVGVNGIYIYPWLTMRANYGFDYTYSKNYQLYYDDATGLVDNTGRSGIFTRNGITNTLGTNMSLGKNGAKVTGNVGLNYRIYRNMMDGELPRYVNQGRTFQALTPSVSVGSEERGSSLTSRVSWRIRYSGGTSDPSLEQLSEYVIRNSDRRYLLGNPDIDQSYTHTLSANLRLQDENAATQVNLNASAGYTFNSMAPYNTEVLYPRIDNPDDPGGPQIADPGYHYILEGVEIPDGSTVTTFRNVDGVRNATFRATIKTPFIGNKFIFDGGLNYRINNDVYYYSVDSTSRGTLKYNPLEIWALSHTPSADLGLRSNHSATIEYGLTNRLSWQRQSYTNEFLKDFMPILSNTRTLTNTTGAHMKLRFLNNFVLAADYSYTYLLQHRGSGKLPTDNSSLLNASFSWEFAKRAAILRVTVYDILNGESGFSTQTTAQAITNSWRQLMSRYVMVTFSYRFNRLYGGTGENKEHIDFQLPETPPAMFGGAMRRGAVESMGGANIPGIMR